MGARVVAAALAVGCLAALGCRQDMHDQPKYKPFRKSTFFGDDRSERPLVEDTVARGQLRTDAAYFTGKQGTTPIDQLPVALTPALMKRGQERFTIYCTPCHGQTGRGDGMVVQRGYRRPPSFHIDRLRNEKAGYFYDVMTSGFGAMPDYAAQVAPADRWAIVAYLRALQMSENARLEDVPADRRAELEAAPLTMPTEAAPGATPEAGTPTTVTPSGAPEAAPQNPASEPPPSARPRANEPVGVPVRPSSPATSATPAPRPSSGPGQP
jgi:mono/diheme cytochrome c family protein